jgi:hypothetical protein
MEPTDGQMAPNRHVEKQIVAMVEKGTSRATSEEIEEWHRERAEKSSRDKRRRENELRAKLSGNCEGSKLAWHRNDVPQSSLQEFPGKMTFRWLGSQTFKTQGWRALCALPISFNQTACPRRGAACFLRAREHLTQWNLEGRESGASVAADPFVRRAINLE